MKTEDPVKNSATPPGASTDGSTSRGRPQKDPPQKESTSSLVWLLLTLLFFRLMVFEPFRIPSGSLIPSLLIGDFLVVSKSAYDIKIPFTDKVIVKVGDPRRGEIIVFNYPNPENNPQKEGLYYIKRLIGLPKDKIKISNGLVSINGLPSQRLVVPGKDATGELPGHRLMDLDQGWGFSEYVKETLPGASTHHWTIRASNPQRRSFEEYECFPLSRFGDFTPTPPGYSENICEFTVPDDSYFFVGDNRDGSADGRMWGFVKRSELVGKAVFVWFSIRDATDNGLEDASYESYLNSLTEPATGGLVALGGLLKIPRGILYDLFHMDEPRYLRWSRIGRSVR